MLLVCPGGVAHLDIYPMSTMGITDGRPSSESATPRGHLRLCFRARLTARAPLVCRCEQLRADALGDLGERRSCPTRVAGMEIPWHEAASDRNVWTSFLHGPDAAMQCQLDAPSCSFRPLQILIRLVQSMPHALHTAFATHLSASSHITRGARGLPRGSKRRGPKVVESSCSGSRVQLIQHSGGRSGGRVGRRADGRSVGRPRGRGPADRRSGVPVERLGGRAGGWPVAPWRLRGESAAMSELLLAALARRLAGEEPDPEDAGEPRTPWLCRAAWASAKATRA